ncbi:Eco47II restriction endonuclease [Moraxella macacae 0408225]|uniref:Eco47II restriction endonuclease n=1 Tax=Moraxella macacae 0408225 TaxID=1230338 RepID=L2F5K1_9GAMM|nr:Eco47II family restriction endonuclease [Moraxella macacae]ELA08165.1 Eco47II restriction endonuclease [Moraxella macacae 0408225]
MSKYNLDFISDDDLYNHVRNTVFKYRFSIDFKKFNKNLIDPIKLTFDSAVYHGGFDDVILTTIIESEIQRQMDKSNTNHIGYFHQNIFNFIGKSDGWVVSKKGFDIENHQRQIYVEMKNKHNTMNSSSSAKTYMRMQHKILQEPKAICMLVEVIAKNSQNVAWQCSLDKQSVKHDQIRRVSIDKFYEIVTGDSLAFKKLCQILPKVLLDVLNNEQLSLIDNQVFNDINKQKINHLLTGLYVLAFKKYQGFDDFSLELS